MIEVRKLISDSVGRLQKVPNSEKLGREREKLGRERERAREGENDIFAEPSFSLYGSIVFTTTFFAAFPFILHKVHMSYSSPRK